MNIEKITKMKNGKYKLVFDNQEKLVVHDDVILKNNLLFNKKVDDDTFEKINLDNSYYLIYNKCIKLISTKIRSKVEIEQYLNKFELEYKTKEKIIKDLKHNKFINDLNFAKAFISDKIHLSNDGPNKIKKSLLEHKIEEDIINELLNNIDQETINLKIEKLINKKIKNTKHSEYIVKQKIKSELFNLGYDQYIVNEYLNNISISSSALEKNYDSYYKKLSKKYSDKELVSKIKTKLYQKGFKREEIDNMVQKKMEY